MQRTSKKRPRSQLRWAGHGVPPRAPRGTRPLLRCRRFAAQLRQPTAWCRGLRCAQRADDAHRVQLGVAQGGQVPGHGVIPGLHGKSVLPQLGGQENPKMFARTHNISWWFGTWWVCLMSVELTHYFVGSCCACWCGIAFEHSVDALLHLTVAHHSLQKPESQIYSLQIQETKRFKFPILHYPAWRKASCWCKTQPHLKMEADNVWAIPSKPQGHGLFKPSPSPILWRAAVQMPSANSLNSGRWRNASTPPNVE